VHLTETFWTSRTAPLVFDKRDGKHNSTDYGLQFLSDRLKVLIKELKVKKEFTDAYGVHHIYVQRSMESIEVTRMLLLKTFPSCFLT
jgi:hypothetical protein